MQHRTAVTRVWASALIAGLICVLAIGAGSLGPVASAAPPALGSLVIGSGIDASYASIQVAVRNGFMERHGINATLKVFPSGQEALEAVLTGQSDFAGNGQYNVPLVAAQGGNIKIIAEYERSDKQFGAVAKSSITKPGDLIGKRVGTQFGTSPEYYYHLYAKHYGLDESKITLVNLQFAQMVPALAKGDIDAFFAFEPSLTRATDDVPGTRILARSGDDGVMPLRVYAGVSQKVYSNKALAVAFLKALIEAGDWANAHPDETATVISQAFQIKPADARRFVGYFDYSVRFDKASLAELDRVDQYLVDRKLVSTKPDLSKFVTTEFMKEADPSRL
ncbi:MAG TPA: ABC transporter substrate-binding protein [bacterium]|nr:ABC transporter substrate-binding protein [bacterium]